MFYAVSETGAWSGANPRCVNLRKKFSAAQELFVQSCPPGYERVGFRWVNLEEADRDQDGSYHLNLRD